MNAGSPANLLDAPTLAQNLKAMFFSFYPSLGYGVQYYVFSQISHINEECFHPIISRKCRARDNMANMILSKIHIFGILIGGLNKL